MRIVWSRDAKRDLLQIWNYLAREASFARADERIEKIRQTAQLLSQWPFSGRIREALLPGMRSIAAPPHVIFYRVRDDAVEIVRVVDGRRDIEAIFRNRP